MTAIKHLPTPTWLVRLTNAQLLQHLGAALNARGPGHDLHLDRRLKILDDEVRRRRSIGQMTDDDLM